MDNIRQSLQKTAALFVTNPSSSSSRRHSFGDINDLPATATATSFSEGPRHPSMTDRLTSFANAFNSSSSSNNNSNSGDNNANSNNSSNNNQRSGRNVSFNLPTMASSSNSNNNSSSSRNANANANAPASAPAPRRRPALAPFPADLASVEGFLNHHLSQIEKVMKRLDPLPEMIDMDGIVLQRLQRDESMPKTADLLSERRDACIEYRANLCKNALYHKKEIDRVVDEYQYLIWNARGVRAPVPPA